MKAFKTIVAAGLLLGATSVMAQDEGGGSDDTGEPIVVTPPPVIKGQFAPKGDPGSPAPTNVNSSIGDNGKFETTAKRNLDADDESQSPIPEKENITNTNTLSASDGGAFTFIIPEAFKISCDESNATLNADEDSYGKVGKSTVIERMMVQDIEELESKGAEAYISCIATTTRSKWTINLLATHGGKMESTETPGEFLQLTGSDGTNPGELGMAIKFIKSWTITSDNTAGYGNNIKTLSDAPVPVTAEGNGFGRGHFIGDLSSPVNLASIVDDAADRFAAWTDDGKPISTGFEFQIHAAFITNNDLDISATSGVFRETIVLTLSPSSI